MKQFITIDQLSELSDQAKQRLGEWIHRNPSFVPLDLPLKDQSYQVIWTEPKTPNNKTYWLPLLSIGQMIEFLDNHNSYEVLGEPYDGGFICKGYRGEHIRWEVTPSGKAFPERYVAEELCDSLWEAVKEILEAD